MFSEDGGLIIFSNLRAIAQSRDVVVCTAAMQIEWGF